MSSREHLALVVFLITCLALPLSLGAEALSPSVATPAFDPVAAAEAYLALVTPEEQARSEAYSAGNRWLMLWNFLSIVAISVLLLESRVSAWLRDVAQRLTRMEAARSLIYAVGFMLLMALLTLPLAFYEGFYREHQYELSNLDFGGWMREFLVGWAVQIAVFAPIAAAVYWAIRRAPRTWHRWATGIVVVYLVIDGAIAPVFVAPVFNHYEPLPESELKQSLLALAQANGMSAKDVYQFDGSKQSDRISANVSGLLGTARIALSDTLLDSLSPEAARAVVGHELGHYVYNHIGRNIVFNGLLIAFGLVFARWSMVRLLAWRGERWGARGPGDVAGLPLLVLLLASWLFVTAPLTNTLIRIEEKEADKFGLDAAREPDGFAEVMLLLGEALHRQPGPIEEFVFLNHPSGRSRIYAAMRWKAEHGGLRPDGGAKGQAQTLVKGVR